MPTSKISTQKLFVALELPESVTTTLTQIQPQLMPGIRLVTADQMYLTIHFIGAGDARKIADVLQKLDLHPVQLNIAGVGHFITRNDSITLWARVQQSLTLMEVHNIIGSVLLQQGYPLEERPYFPHITLARSEESLAQINVSAWMQEYASFSMPPVTIERLHLYSSSLEHGVPIYRSERTFPLIGV